jgi:hypothetical protein
MSLILDPNSTDVPDDGIWFRQPPQGSSLWKEIYDNVSGQMNGREAWYERGRGMVLRSTIILP